MIRRQRCPSFAILLLVSGGFLGSPSIARAANTPPVAVADTVETHARQGVLIDLLANDRDVDGDPLTVAVAAPSLGEVVDHGDGTVTYTPDPDLFENSGGESLSYTLSDGRGGSSGATVTVVEIPVPADRQPLADPVVLLDEDFDDGDMNGWTIVDHPSSIYGPSSWSATSGYALQTSNIGQPGTWAVYDGGSGWIDYRLQLSLWSGDDDAIGAVFRYQGPDDYYVFYWSNWFGDRRLYKRQAGSFILLASSPGAYRRWDRYRVEITVEGSRIQLVLDGDLLFDLVDSTFASGSVGLYSGHNTSSHFDDIRVTEVPEAPPLLLEDDFADGDFEGWVIADSGRNSFPSNWQVTNGELAQTSNINASRFIGVGATRAMAEAGYHWTDYRFQVKLRGTDDDVIILNFRFQDLENHYSLHWSHQSGKRYLRKRVDGQWVDLVTQNVVYWPGDEYLVEIVADGSQLEVWIDGRQVISVQDDALRAGTVGLACEGMAGVYFDNVKVTAIP